MAVPKGFELARTTVPYYRSTYVFVSRRDRRLQVRSFDDAALERLRIGVHVVGDDYNNVPPAEAHAARVLIQNVRVYSIYGDYSQPDPPRSLVNAIAAGKVDIAIVWGPLAGYFSAKEDVPLELVPVSKATSMTTRRWRSISRWVSGRRHRTAHYGQSIITAHGGEIDALLARFGVPRLGRAAASP